jgi:hypothetical protein
LLVDPLTERNGLSGTIASELKELSNLKFLSLQNGVISGVLPTQLGMLTGLEVIDMNFNLIGGSLPDELFNLSNLRQLDMNDNALVGSISMTIGNLSSLTFLQLHRNMMTGVIPTEIGALPGLGMQMNCLWRQTISRRLDTLSTFLKICLVLPAEVATFQENMFQGTMPPQMCSLVDAGVLMTLTSDCSVAAGRVSPPFVECLCCTQCF